MASDLSFSLEELHPKLFDAFASAPRTLERAETEEDLAQADLSGRRLLEKTADYLFPPRGDDWKVGQVGNAQCKNRLWAYVEQTIDEAGLDDPALLATLGKKADLLVKLFNETLHADPMRQKVEATFCDLVLWLTEVINLSPEQARRPNLAHARELSKFLKQLAEKPAVQTTED